jgi:hypothetical protein
MGIFMLFLVSPWFKDVQALPKANLALEVLGGTLGVVGAVAAIVIWFGMLTFCFCEDDSPLRAKILWVFLFFVAAWFGSAAYFFRVYRKQIQFASTPSV